MTAERPEQDDLGRALDRFAERMERILKFPEFPKIPEGSADTQRGCICPPAANLTCQNVACPRKGAKTP